jgi:MtrB/PioB family decaheme-associated outer membrane protein
MKATRQNPFILTAVAAALLLAFKPALAQNDEIKQLTTPVSTVDVGAGYVSKDNLRFGQYTGLNEKGAYGIVDFSLVKRDNSTGTWFTLQGRNLGFDDRELRLGQERQGDWGYYIDYSRIPRYEPYTVNTGLQGVGTTSQTFSAITPGAGTDYQLSTKRDRWTLGLEKALYGWSVNVRYRNEQKDGTQLWGTGYFSVQPRFLTKPVDTTTQQIDVTADYNTERYQIRAGYYGTMFDNKIARVNVSPAIANLFTAYGMEPDNQSHQFYVTGGYNFSQATRGTFKLAYARATQNDPWGIAPPVGVTQGSLDGRVDTTLVQAGLNGRVTPKLSWRADLRYENRDDKTPVVVNPSLGSYKPRSIETTTGKVVANYSLPMGFRLTGDITLEQKKREAPEDTVVQFRERVNETTYRVELRRAVSPTVTGAVSLLHSKRDGSGWRDDLISPAGFIDIAPIYLADRDRNTVRFVVNWMPTEPLSLNFRADESRDTYTGRNSNPYNLGPRKGRASNYSLDTSYMFTQSVTGTAWLSHGDTRFEEATCAEFNFPGTCDPASTAFAEQQRNIADNFGLGLRAKATSKIDVGADVTYAKVRDEFSFDVLNAVGTITPVDNINTKVTTLRLYGKYALNRQSGIRLDYVYDQYQTDDWTWSRWIYSTADGTTITQDPNQKVNFVGVSYYYRFQ